MRQRGERSQDFSMPGRLSWGPRIDNLLRRFEATIPLRRLVCVRWVGIRTRDGVMSAVGVPHSMKEQIIFLRRPGELVWIPKSHIISMEGFTMPKNEELPANAMPASTPPPGWVIDEIEDLPTAPNALAPTDDKYPRFQTAVVFEERVRITSSQPVTDPAIQEPNLIRDGITTIHEGTARLIDDDWLHIGEPPPSMQAMTAIPRVRVLNIEFLGPRPVEEPA